MHKTYYVYYIYIYTHYGKWPMTPYIIILLGVLHLGPMFRGRRDTIIVTGTRSGFMGRIIILYITILFKNTPLVRYIKHLLLLLCFVPHTGRSMCQSSCVHFTHTSLQMYTSVDLSSPKTLEANVCDNIVHNNIVIL